VGLNSGTLLRRDLSSEQRRFGLRYPFDTEVAYRFARTDDVVTEGSGRTVNISSRGLLIVSEPVLPIGVIIEVQIPWPLKLDGCISLNLYIRGHTVRSTGNQTGIAIRQYDFRTRGSHRFERDRR
jgi:hypothetical protein